MSRKAIFLTPKEYQDKRFQASTELLASALNKLDGFNAIGEDKQLESIVSNCIFLSDQLIKELGFVQRDSGDDNNSVHSLRDILNSDEDD